MWQLQNILKGKRQQYEKNVFDGKPYEAMIV